MSFLIDVWLSATGAVYHFCRCANRERESSVRHFGLLVSQGRPTGISVTLTNYRKCRTLVLNLENYGRRRCPTSLSVSAAVVVSKRVGRGDPDGSRGGLSPVAGRGLNSGRSMRLNGSAGRLRNGSGWPKTPTAFRRPYRHTGISSSSRPS